MQITLGKATGLELIRTDVYRGFLLMIRGWEVSYVHYLEDYIGIAWKLWAKKTPTGIRYSLSKK
jgi:hypothetical protein